MTRAGDSDPLLGRVLDGKFTLLSVLGRGGMGVVYRAHQASLERSVALKLLMDVADVGPDGPDGERAESRDLEFQQRFFLEAATAAKLKHPNTITVFDYGSATVDDDRVFYITMELLEGVTLSKLLSREGPLPPLRAVNIALQICRSLREAHSHGIVHRDLKPGNIMLVKQDDADADDDGGGDFVKVLDFGLAKTRLADGKRPQQLTKAGTFLGSPRYVAPEQIEGRPLDGRADIYSFGCVLYRMLTGRVPFDGQQAVEVMLKHLHDPVPPMNVSVSSDGAGAPLVLPKTLEALVLKCLQKNASDRPTSMDEVISTLKRVRGEITGVLSGTTLLPDDLHARIAREAANPNSSGPNTSRPDTSGPVPAHRASTTLAPTAPVPSAPTTRPKTPRHGGGEQTSPSQTSPSSSSSSASSLTGTPKKSSSSSQPSLSTPLALGLTPGPLSISGEWKIGPPTDESTRPTHGPDPGAVAPRRTPGAAIAAGVVVGVLLAGVGIAARLGHLDGAIDAVVESAGSVAADDPPAPLRPRGPVALQAASARLRIKTDPPGADVYDVTPPRHQQGSGSGQQGVPRLLGITPLVVPWTIAAGDPSKELLLKLPGHVTARARVEPPPPSGQRDPVTLDVDATLRPVPP